MAEITTLTNFSQAWLGSYTNTKEEYNLKSLCLYNDKVILSVAGWMYSGFVKVMEKEGIRTNLITDTFISLQDVSSESVNTIFDHTITPAKLLGEVLDNEATKVTLQALAV